MRAEKTPAAGGAAGVTRGLADQLHYGTAGDVPPVTQRANPSDVTLAILRRSAAAFGLTLCCRCSRCNAPLWNARSVSAKLGPVCRTRVPE